MIRDFLYRKFKDVLSILIISLVLLLTCNINVQAEESENNDGKKIEIDNYDTILELFVEPIFEDRMK